MRILEIALILAVAAAAAVLLRGRGARTPSGRALAILAAAAAIAQFAFEGIRWQMLPVFAAAAILLAWQGIGGPAIWRNAGPRPLGLVGGLVGALLAAMGAALAWALPVPALPAPGGPYQVGTITFHWIDTAREEAYLPTPGRAPRELMVQVWHPAAPPTGERPAPWLPDVRKWSQAVGERLGVPGFLFNHLPLTRGHAYWGAPVAEGGPFPVVLYSHGWTGFRAIASDQAEELASQGYIVFAPDHPYGAMATAYPDGRVALNNPAALPSRDETPPETWQAAIEQLAATYAADLAFVLDQAERMAEGGIPSYLGPHLDLSRVGVYGHSTGGAAAVLLAMQDARVKALLGQDVWAEPIPDESLDTPLPVPLLFIDSELWVWPANADRVERLFVNAAHDARHYQIAGAAHGDFTLFPLLSPLAGFSENRGVIDARRVLELNREALVAYFDWYLRELPAPLLDDPAGRYHELTVRERFKAESWREETDETPGEAG